MFEYPEKFLNPRNFIPGKGVITMFKPPRGFMSNKIEISKKGF